MMYIRYPLSQRNTDDLLHERGIEISHETERYRRSRFGPLFAPEIRNLLVSGTRPSRWHLDEVFLKVNGELHYLWRAVDHEHSDPVDEIIATARAANAILPRKIDAHEICDRLAGAILNGSALVLAEKVAWRPGDIDVTLVHGYGFPHWIGGPLLWASGQTSERVADMIEAAATATGRVFARGPLEKALDSLRADRHEIEKRKVGYA